MTSQGAREFGSSATFGLGPMRLQAAELIPFVVEDRGEQLDIRRLRGKRRYHETMAKMERDIVRLSTNVCGAAKGKALREWAWRKPC